MARFKYNGDHINMECFGLVFRVDGENQSAETEDPYVLGKLRGNSHFDEVVEALDDLTREGLQEYAKERYGVDLPMGAKADMRAAVDALGVGEE